MSVTVTSKGRITIPKRVRDFLGIQQGSLVDFQRGDDGRIVLVKVETKARDSRVARVRGHAGNGLTTDEIMAMVRGSPAGRGARPPRHRRRGRAAAAG
ncbi:MAG: AbrB/MazE/SpoVT family DNA-binding domain-containing protein [Rhodospirillales bacterium]|nr:AbrB/MazE/SpoVT family DNA-binding domain-containing protein [Rhodospirillales bacterium]